MQSHMFMTTLYFCYWHHHLFLLQTQKESHKGKAIIVGDQFDI